MFGRVNRAVHKRLAEEAVDASGLLKVYDPQAIAGAAAIGLGIAGGLGGGGQATGKVLDAITAWGAHERLRYVKLPPTVLVVVTHDEVRLFEWSFSRAPGLKARWPNQSFTAEKLHFMGEAGVRVTTHEGQVARLSGRSGPLHLRTRQLIEAIVAHSVNGASRWPLK